MQQQQQQQYPGPGGMRRPSNLGPGLDVPNSKVEKRRTRLMFMDSNAPGNGGDGAESSTTGGRGDESWHSNAKSGNPEEYEQDYDYDWSSNANSDLPGKLTVNVNGPPQPPYRSYSPSPYPNSASPLSPRPPAPIEKSPRHMGGGWQQEPRRPPQHQPQRQLHPQHDRQHYGPMRTGGGEPRMGMGMNGRPGPRPDMGGRRPGLPSGPGAGLRNAGRVGNPMVRRPVEYYD